MILERLPLDKQEMMKNFADDLERYIWETDWTGESSEEVLPVSIQIYLSDASVSYEYRFSGTFLVSNTTDLQYSDKYWIFPFSKENKLTHSDLFNPLTGFIDFYIDLILGAEFDARGELAGQPYYDKARALGEQAMFNSQFVLGWRERNELMDRLFSDEFKEFRFMKDRYFLGLSYKTESDTTAARYALDALDKIEIILRPNPDFKEAELFLEGHRQEWKGLLQANPAALTRLEGLGKQKSTGR